MKKVGILGAGQLGRMLALAGYPLGLDFNFYDISGNPSAGLGKITIDTEFKLDNPALVEFIAQVDVVTYEFEHLPLDLTQHIERQTTLHPSSESIRVCQNRVEEKKLFRQLGIPTAKFHVVNNVNELFEAVRDLGCPVVTKSTTEGYDGKGQFVIRTLDQCQQAWDNIGHNSLLAETFVEFKRELSIIAVRSQKDEVAVYPIAENMHQEGILRYSTAPAPELSQELEQQATQYIKELMHELNHVGVLTLELFETDVGLLANEMAPRVHNSGHWSIEGTQCSQFENHLRAICGFPLGSTETDKLTCMINLIGCKGNISEILALPYAHVHLYGKEERPGRKLGHITVQADNLIELRWRINNVVSYLPDTPEFIGFEAVKGPPP